LLVVDAFLVVDDLRIKSLESEFHSRSPDGRSESVVVHGRVTAVLKRSTEVGPAGIDCSQVVNDISHLKSEDWVGVPVTKGDGVGWGDNVGVTVLDDGDLDVREIADIWINED
jgi:hypothetical protein